MKPLAWLIASTAIALIPPPIAIANELVGPEQIERQISQLSYWGTDGDRLYSICRFRDFPATIEFVNRLVAPAETLAHHPDLAIAYNRLSISVTTHDAGGLTALDFQLANRIEQLIARAEQDLGAICQARSQSESN